MDPDGIQRDRQNLERATAPVFRYAQLLVAHRTPIDKMTLTGAQLDTAIAAIAKTAGKYYVILIGQSLQKKWGRLPRGWKKAFTVPWHVEKKRSRKKK